MNLYVLSDIHLKFNNDKFHEKFIKFLNKIPSNDKLLLCGDIFEIFIHSKRSFRKIYNDIILAMENTAERGVEIHFVEGNHDFFMTKVFKSKNIKVYESGECELSINSKKVYVCHGDDVLPHDYGYKFMKKILRNKLSKALLWIFPGRLLAKTAEFSSKQSKKHTSKMKVKYKGPIMRFMAEFAEKKLAQNFDYVFIGHSHLYDRKDYENKKAYINVGDVRENDKLIFINESGEISEQSFSRFIS